VSKRPDSGHSFTDIRPIFFQRSVHAARSTLHGDTLTLSAEASVQKAAELIRTQHVGALALTDPVRLVRVPG
jgi:hypothetical protein